MSIIDLFSQTFNDPTSLWILLSLIVIESILSVDNAAVLATMVRDLPLEQRNKALKYGIFGAFFFRGLAMVFASFLIKIWWLKPVGGIYLLYLVYDWYKGKQSESNDEESINKQENWLYKFTLRIFGNFWSTVCLVELMDLAFSIDNVFAVVSITPNITLVCIGVFIGIISMRFIAQWFVKLMSIYSFLETSAFIVIAILGVKLLLSLVEKFLPQSSFAHFLASPIVEVAMPALTISLFFIPIITSRFVNIPKKSKA
jgi:YkoY family integral membrane protein